MPVPADGEVLVHVLAAGVNPGETNIRIGMLHDRFPATFPSGEGSDLAGVITAVGSGVSQFSVGDEVLGFSWNRSSHATDVTVPVTQLIHKPAALSWEVAGSLYVVGCTAFAAVRAVDAGPGDTVAVSAAAGGVGSMVVQLLKARGATVIGIASERNAGWLLSHGVTPVAYGDGIVDRLADAADQGIDAFIDLFGPEYVQLAVDLGVARERIETIIAWDKAEEFGTKQDGSASASTPEVLEYMASLVADGTIELPIAATYPLDRVADAFAQVEERHTHGKVVLVP
jgi:NADPH:quinone reductase